MDKNGQNKSSESSPFPGSKWGISARFGSHSYVPKDNTLYEHELDHEYYDSFKCATNSNEVLLPSKPGETEVYWITAETKSKDTPVSGSVGNTGKWLLYEYSWNVDQAWGRIKAAVEAGLLGSKAKVNTTKSKPAELGGQVSNHVIIVSTTSDFEHREKVRMELFKLGYHEQLSYKTNLDSLAGNYKHGQQLFQNYFKTYNDAEGNLNVLYEGKFYKVRDQERLFAIMKDGAKDEPQSWMFEQDFKIWESRKDQRNQVPTYKQNDFTNPRQSCNPSSFQTNYFRYETRRTPFGKIMVYIKQIKLEGNLSDPSVLLCWDQEKESKVIGADLYDLVRTPFDSTIKNKEFSVKGKNVNLSVFLELKYSELLNDYAIEFRGKGYKAKTTVLVPLTDAQYCYKILIKKFS